FLKGFTVFFWATATWWIPMLVTLAIWRHIYKRFRLAYDPLYWGAVFPLGMYTVSTHQLAQALNLPFLLWIPHSFVYVAIVAWVATFAGLLWTAKNLRVAKKGVALSTNSKELPMAAFSQPPWDSVPDLPRSRCLARLPADSRR